MTSEGVIRTVVAAIVAYGIVVGIGSAAAAPLDPAHQETGRYAVTIVAAFGGSIAGTVAGAWQARAAGTQVPLQGLGVAGATVLVFGILFSAATGGTSATGDLLLYLVHPLGALVGVTVYGTRWLSA